MSVSGSVPVPPPLPPSLPAARSSSEWNRPEDIIPERKSRTGIGRAAPGHFTIHPEDWESPIFRNAVVPDEDNPLRGWRRFGADLLHADLWPALARINPVLAYLTGRRRGAETEDMLGLAPWFAFAGWHAVLLLAAPPPVAATAIALELVLLPVGVAACSGFFAGLQIRRSMQGLPFEELMTTPLKPEHLVQGLTIRPMAVQAAAAFAYLCLHVPLLVLAKVPAAVFLLPLAAMLFKVAVELGGALGARAHFCIRDPGVANLRMVLDLVRLLFLRVCVPLVVVVATLGFLATISAFLFFLLGAIVVVAALFMPWLLYRYLREDAIRSMQWTCEHPEEWWVNEINDHDRLVPRRGLFTPWDYVVDVTPPAYRQPQPRRRPSNRT